MKKVGEKIKAIRLSKDWSQEQTAYELGISLPTYSKIERSITDIQYSRIEQIAKLFKLTVIELLSYGEKDNKNYKAILEEKDKEIMQLQKRIIELIDKKK